MSDVGWAPPGVPSARPAPAPAGDVQALTGAIDDVLSTDPGLLAPERAVARAEALLAAQDRLSAAALRAVADVDARDLWRERSTGSTRTWLRTLPCGDRGQLSTARALQDRPLLGAALAAGAVSLRVATVVARELARVPAHVPEDQLAGVLVDGVGDLARVWAGAACLDPTGAQEAEFEARRRRLAEAVQTGLRDGWSDPADRLEPALVLLAEELAPAEVEAGVGLLVDALLPEADLDALEEREYRDRGLTLRKLTRGGWSLRAHLSDETGQLLHEQLQARLRAHPLQVDRSEGAEEEPRPPEDVFGRPTEAAEPPEAPQPQDDDGDGASDGDRDGASDGDDTGTPPSDEADVDDVQRFGSVGSGTALDPTDAAVQGTPLPSRDQRLHDALGQLLADLCGVQAGSGCPAPGTLTVVAPLDALEGRPGAPPGRLRTAGGDVPLTSRRVRALACRSLLTAVLVDARGRPVGAAGSHRHATARERRILRANWGSTCGVNGCVQPGTVPHHAEPFWKSRQTRQADLVPLCEHHHHDVHEGHKTLRLRDGRLLDEQGWVSADGVQRWAV